VPEFFRVFFIEHNLERFSTNLYQHSQPIWYYIPVFLLSTLPWTIFTLPALVDTCAAETKRLRDRETASAAAISEPGRGDDRLPLFLLLWTVIPILFFSSSRSKLPGYILPAILPAILLSAAYLDRRGTVSRIQVVLHSLVCGLILCGALIAPWQMLKEPVPEATRTLIIFSTGIIAVVVLLAVRRGGLRALHFATLVPVSLALAFLLRMAAIPPSQVVADGGSHPVSGLILDVTKSARPVNLQLRSLGVKDGTPVALLDLGRDLAYGLNFYRNQAITYYDPEPPRDLFHKIPDEEHVVICKAGSGDAVRAVVSPRQVKALGSFPPQHLEFFLVSSAD
jgi:4-amino-4-deoxy-L-arabinose transferase-like glycosyltransferase